MDTSTLSSTNNSPLHSPDSRLKNKSNNRGRSGRKRKRIISESSSDVEDVLPENTLEVEKNLHASAVKNNLDDVSVRKILKKVVTNDHVLALVKLREEEEKAMEMESLQPKLTRAKVKELMKVSPKTAWNLENLELTPIKHIPVKTRPEVEALITQELQEDEDDDEYEPTHDDVPSDDDQTLESCSDVDSQPRTPATPRRLASPRVLRDGPFKVPQDVSSPRRKLDLDGDATIALRTRSKLSLSSIPIDHIESSFVPPDDLPLPVADDVWTEFLQECMNPEASKNEDDDDDPEYNVAADPDANDDDEEGLENIMKISKKELNDLVTELFNIMPETSSDDTVSDKLAANDTVQNGSTIPPVIWEGKQEPVSDDEEPTPEPASSVTKKTVSASETEPPSDPEGGRTTDEPPAKQPRVISQVQPGRIVLSVVEAGSAVQPAAPDAAPPPPLRGLLHARTTLRVQLDAAEMLPEQIKILEQQLRQHIQLASSSFLQLFAHPVHWSLAASYREYLDTLDKVGSSNPKSVANVCNLKPALALVRSWEETMSADTPENAKVVEFVQNQIERARRRAAQNNLYVGDFHERFLTVVANSPVFLYPHLLPAIPFRSDCTKRFNYLPCEDELIALGMDQFWRYVEDNPELYKLKKYRASPRQGLSITLELLCKHMLPWLSPKQLVCHIDHVRKSNNEDNAVYRYFKTREIRPVQHVLLPFNPNLTLYEQPEDEMPRAWIRHLATSSQRFRDYYYSRAKKLASKPTGVAISLGVPATPPPKNPLPIIFRDQIVTNESAPTAPNAPKQNDKFDISITNLTPENVLNTPAPTLYSVIQTPAGAYLIPLSIVTNTVNTVTTPITSTQVNETVANDLPEESVVPTVTESYIEHCICCVRLRKICKLRQSLITDFTGPIVKVCPCKESRWKKYPKISNKLWLLLKKYKTKSHCAWQGLQVQLESLREQARNKDNQPRSKALVFESDDIADVSSFQLKLAIRTGDAKNKLMKRKVNTLLSRFHPEKDDPFSLFRNMSKALEIECVDVWKEFLGFLTAEQADKLGKFMDYFKQECLADLMMKIEEQVTNRHHKLSILETLHRLLQANRLTPCQVCADLLESLERYPDLARHVFSLFPHLVEHSESHNAVNRPAEQIQQQKEVTESNCDEDDGTICDNSVNAEKQCEASAAVDTELAVNHEADLPESDDDDSLDTLTIVEDNRPEVSRYIKTEDAPSENVIDTPLLTVTKTEIQDRSESDITDMSMMVMSEDEIKSEPEEWTRDEDKLLLEVLKTILTPEERKDKTILEILEEKNLPQTIAKSIPKSLSDIRERIMYVLQFFVNDE